MAKLRKYGPPIYLASPVQLDLTMQVTGTGAYTYDGSVISYPSVPAGYYSFGEFCILVSQLIRTWMFAVANSGVTLPVAIGTEDTIGFTIDWVSSGSGVFNGSRVNFTITDPSCTVGGTKAAVTALTLGAGWPHLLGLGQEDAAVAGSIVAPFGAQCLGVFCPRAINETIRSERRSSKRRVSELYTPMMLSDGSIETYEIDGNRGEEAWSIVNNAYAISGDPMPIGTLQSISAGRLSLYCAYPKVTGRVTGITRVGLWAPFIPAGAYVAIEGAGGGGFMSRVKEVITPGTEGGVNRLEIVLWEKVPSTFAIKVGSPLYRAPDAWAARHISKGLGVFLLYGADELGNDPWIWEDWALSGDGDRFIQTVERRNDNNNQYTITFTGLRRVVSRLTIVIT